MVHRRGCAITFNGEIYNYRVLRDELCALGHSFETSSDTEVILAAYEEWGPSFVARLEGMYAFAIYDPRTRRVVAARDRAGEKPFYFRATDRGVSFASEVKALLADPASERRISAVALNHYLAYGYTTGSATIFSGIQRLEPGCMMLLDTDECRYDISRYWQIPKHAPVDTDPEALTTHLHALLRDAVSRQLVADVPVGILLSGGVDSSIIAAIAAEVSSTPISTYTVRFPGSPSFDEGPFARMVASYLGTSHTELEASPASTDLLGRLARQFDEPMADSSMVPMFLVSEEIRRHATVAIGGDGGDELFAGYKRYPGFVRGEQLRALVPSSARRAAAAIGSRLIPEGGLGRGTLQGLAGELGDSIASAGRIFLDTERASLSPCFADWTALQLRQPESRRAALYAEMIDPVSRATSVDFTTYMIDDVLVKVDRASMLSSLEVRAPFLDPSVINFAFAQVPNKYRATSRERKVLLKHLGRRILPSKLDLSRKQGFSIPLRDWLCGMWRPIVDELGADRSSIIISGGTIRRYQKMLDEGRPVASRLFSLVLLRMWEQEYSITGVTAD